MVTEAVLSLGAPYGVHVEVDYLRGVPPVVNDAECVETLRQAASAVLGAGQVCEVEQSLGGEDFAWFLEHALGRSHDSVSGLRAARGSATSTEVTSMRTSAPSASASVC